MQLTHNQILRLVAMWKLENELTKAMEIFGGKEVTISDFTRELRKHPETVKMMDDLIAKMDAFEETEKSRKKTLDNKVEDETIDDKEVTAHDLSKPQ